MARRRDVLILAGAIAATTAGGGAAAQQRAPARPFSPVGRWRFFHTDGTPFLARIMPDGSATTDWDGGERGIWRWEGEALRLLYTDGWDDLLLLDPAGRGFVKRGWAPEANRCGAPSNQTLAERLSEEPGPPL